MQRASLGQGTVPGTGPHGHLFVPDCLPTGFVVGPHLQACPLPWDELDHFPALPLVLVANADQRQSILLEPVCNAPTGLCASLIPHCFRLSYKSSVNPEESGSFEPVTVVDHLSISTHFSALPKLPNTLDC